MALVPPIRRWRLLLLLVCALVLPENMHGFYLYCDRSCDRNEECLYPSAAAKSFGITECSRCPMGKYKEEKGPGQCKYCADNTLPTNAKQNPQIETYCEDTCYYAWLRWKASSEKTRRVFIGNFVNVPCIKKCIGDDPNKLNSVFPQRFEKCDYVADECTRQDDTWAENAIIQLKMPLSAGENEDEKHGNLWPEWGRVCVHCETGKYIQEGKCTDCPGGFIPVDTSVASQLSPPAFIPLDVKKLMFDRNIMQGEFPKHNFFVFSCRVCSVAEGIATSTGCSKCKDYEYQEAKEVNIEKSRLDVPNFKVLISDACKRCPGGYQRKNPTKQCRGNYQECCEPCKENHYGEDGSCKMITPDHVTINGDNTIQAVGATKQRTCVHGEELISCDHEECVSVSAIRPSAVNGWRTCGKCADSDLKVPKEANGCTLCDETKSQRNKDEICTSCSTCSQLKVDDPKYYAIHAIQEPFKKYAMDHDGFDLKWAEKFQYWASTTTAYCEPLKRLQVKVTKNGDHHTLSFQDKNQYRNTEEDPNVFDLEKFYTIDRHGEKCAKTHCSKVCMTTFHYSPSCGKQIITEDIKNIWVHIENTDNILRLSDLVTQQMSTVAQYNVSHGVCEKCTLCAKGYHNPTCNVYSDDVNPIGQCQTCKTECNVGFFMYHPDGEAGCHIPPETKCYSTSNKCEIDKNYECMECPKWVLHDNLMSIVTACGQGETYQGPKVKDGLVEAHWHDIKWTEEEIDLRKLGVNWKNYRNFMRDLTPYCPTSYFFDKSQQGCSDDSLRQTKTVEKFQVNVNPVKVVSYGFAPFNPNCCTLCKETDLNKKKTAYWKECTGDTVTDTQDEWVDRCGFGFYEDKDTQTCLRCRSCNEGMLFSA